MNAESKMAERLLQVIQPHQENRLIGQPLPEAKDQPRLEPESAYWPQIADLMGTFGPGIRELASPLSD